MDLRGLVRALTSLVRTGWMLRGVPASMGETVAEHSFVAALIAADLSQYVGADPYRAAMIALVHDATEAVVGDIPKTANIGQAKGEAERAALSKLDLPKPLREALLEYMEGRSLESKVARLADLVATAIVADEYEGLGFDVGEIKETSAREIEQLAGELASGPLKARLRELGVLR